MMTDDKCDPEPHAPQRHEAPAVARRRFLAVAALGVLGVTLGTAGGAVATMPVRPLPAPGLLSLLGCERTQQLGARYRELVPAEDDAMVLLQSLRVSSQPNPTSDLDAGLTALIQDDFSHGRTVTVHGWILARTEARQCALYSLFAA